MTHSGTTSACAENTGLIVSNSPPCGNYLRVRGEYAEIARENWEAAELPPRARRILTCSGEVRGVKGTTSACAENTFGAVFLINIIGNYLRVRGEYARHVRVGGAWGELPPRARRIHHHSGSISLWFGTTSACAENTSVCGIGIRTALELPPRARRIR